MDPAHFKIPVIILQHHCVPVYVVGELALNYYNVPRVCHDTELCVPKDSVRAAADILISTGLFEPSELAESEHDIFSSYKRGFPRLKTTPGWTHPVLHLVIFPSEDFGLDGSGSSCIRWTDGKDSGHVSHQILDTVPEEHVRSLPFPRLPPLLIGYARRYVESQDDPSMMATEQLVDGMDLDEAWCAQHLSGVEPRVVDVIVDRVQTRHQRLDDFAENTVTCYVKDEEQAVLTDLFEDRALSLALV
ncbi:hypothetical protein DHEL01_v207612 [Diaporthe helianthi]|uniref:Uncharacterized protein n=1 Tax=Diaporthe helianthi TaxID=158607 RepID=A0A2P5HUP6_DIAHE|nr:hypothetical protein DHEL01_v207612 [Diaporthe helianthi]